MFSLYAKNRWSLCISAGIQMLVEFVRLSLEPDRPYLSQTGLWRSYEKAVGVACWKIRFQFFRTVTNDTNPLLVLLIASAIFDAIKRNFATGSFRLRIQPVDATDWPNLSAGVS
jgi:hypothetical protein